MDVLRAIAAYQDREGWMPSLEELCDELSLASRSTVHAHVDALIAESLVERKHRDSEQWRITDLGRRLLNLVELAA